MPGVLHRCCMLHMSALSCRMPAHLGADLCAEKLHAHYPVIASNGSPLKHGGCSNQSALHEAVMEGPNVLWEDVECPRPQCRPQSAF